MIDKENIIKSKAMHEEPRYTTNQAVDYLTKAGFPVSKPTLERYRKDGIGPVYLRIAKRIFYPKSALDEFVSGTPVFPVKQNVPETTPNKKELLPCPFCGDKAELRNAGGSIEACCTGIGCYAKRRCSSPLQEDAIAKWNERL